MFSLNTLNFSIKTKQARFLITAGHCTQSENSNPRLVYAVIGTFHRLSGGVTVKLDKIMVHENFDSRRLLNDVSLLRTAEEIIFTKLIKPIALPTMDIPKFGDKHVLLSGWGATSYPSNSQLPDILQFTYPRTLSMENCTRLFGGTSAGSLVHSSMICTINAKNVGACLGDSGA